MVNETLNEVVLAIGECHAYVALIQQTEGKRTHESNSQQHHLRYVLTLTLTRTLSSTITMD